ncbi:MAG: 4-hydroxythreonine-4-phosphate dehydrogenase PdxA [Candidatus Sumerlaea chitinivorans]|nr:4-hydroxythreonine-4-phosphate dehydrogenase PdxA [Candidatus Sumerlaea chitinivorans]
MRAKSEKCLRLAITMGDPGGVGPELVACVLRELSVAGFQALVFGSAELLREAANLRQLELPPLVTVQQVEEAGAAEHPVVVVEAPEVGSEFVRGRAHPANGRAALRWIELATQAVLGGAADALVTAPISKDAIRAAGSPFPGHTEYLASLCGNAEVRMMLEGGGLRVVLETIHVPLADVPKLISREHLRRTLEIAHTWAQEYLTPTPRIGVCGLNPHAGENGHFGSEELEIIGPTVAEARDKGIAASDPLPADTAFYRALRGEFDLVVAMYHDQGLVAVKTLAFETGVNITLGLPIIRTSPDHGTAFDIAWQGRAQSSSMTAAVRRAIELAEQRRASRQKCG